MHALELGGGRGIGGATPFFFRELVMNIPTTITFTVIPEAHRIAVVEKLFGIRYVTLLEPTVFNMAGVLAAGYDGAYWEFFSLSNGGFFMAPRGEDIYDVCCENGFEGKLSSSGLGLAACLYAYSHLSFEGDAFADLCANQYHLVREYMFQHHEAESIARAID
jgi:hypothetical protein